MYDIREDIKVGFYDSLVSVTDVNIVHARLAQFKVMMSCHVTDGEENECFYIVKIALSESF